jgi:hypothetical protein
MRVLRLGKAKLSEVFKTALIATFLGLAGNEPLPMQV